MNCPSCSLSMALVQQGTVYWCEVCGTIKTSRGFLTPVLVREVQALSARMPTDLDDAVDAEPAE